LLRFFNPDYALKKVVRAFLPAIIGITGRNARATFFNGFTGKTSQKIFFYFFD